VNKAVSYISSWTQSLNELAISENEDDQNGYAKNSFMKNIGQIILAIGALVVVIVALGGMHLLAMRYEM